MEGRGSGGRLGGQGEGDDVGNEEYEEEEDEDEDVLIKVELAGIASVRGGVAVRDARQASQILANFLLTLLHAEHTHSGPPCSIA